MYCTIYLLTILLAHPLAGFLLLTIHALFWGAHFVLAGSRPVFAHFAITELDLSWLYIVMGGVAAAIFFGGWFVIGLMAIHGDGDD